MMFFVIDNQYVFTHHINAKIPNVSTRRIWIDATTGKAIFVEEGFSLKVLELFPYTFRIRSPNYKNN